MSQQSTTPGRAPSLIHAFVCFAGVLLTLGFGLFLFAISIHTLMFLCVCWVALNTRWLGFDYPSIRSMMSDGISRALPAIYIFILIGMVIASYMHSGTIASLIVYGLDLLSPAFFLAAGFVLCSLMSVATGTSWGTAGTIGVVLIGLGESMGVPLPLVAGAVISGATFGDKLSPISDTTNLAAMSAGTDLYTHIRSMLYTTTPTFALVLVILLILGGGTSHSDSTGTQSVIQVALRGAYDINLVVALLPLLVLLGLSVARRSAEVSMTSSVAVAVVLAVVYQDRSFSEVLNALWQNTPGKTGIESVDSLLGRGGIASMSWTLMLALMALALGGMLNEGGFLKALLERAIARIRRTASLIATTIATSIVSNMGFGEAYVSIILNAQLFRQSFDRARLDRAVLSRSVEEGATLSTGLIPWTTAGAFYAATLGVPTLEYAPYAFLNYLNPLISIAMALLGVGLLRRRAVA